MNITPAMVTFDLYGTLIQSGVKHHPFRKILLWARDQGRKPGPDDARNLMTHDAETEQLLGALGIYPPAGMIKELHREIQEELDSMTLFDDVLPTLNALTDAGIPIAICSNLARPYGVIIDKLLPEFSFLRCLSYEVGAIKPEKALYDWIVRESGFSAKQILFVGDTRIADYEGPRQYGFHARHIVRSKQQGGGTISNLGDILILEPKGG